jgi:GTPase SAR1 family protein
MAGQAAVLSQAAFGGGGMGGQTAAFGGGMAVRGPAFGMEPAASAALDAVPVQIALIGARSAGKSSLLWRWQNPTAPTESAPPRLGPTSGVEYHARIVGATRTLNVHASDTGGAGGSSVYATNVSDHDRAMACSRKAQAIMLCVNVTSRDEFDHLPQTLSLLQRQLAPHTPLVYLVGCQADVDERHVSLHELQHVASSHALLSVDRVFETSAKYATAIRTGRLTTADLCRCSDPVFASWLAGRASVSRSSFSTRVPPPTRRRACTCSVRRRDSSTWPSNGTARASSR